MMKDYGFRCKILQATGKNNITIETLASWPDADILAIENIGRRTLERLRAMFPHALDFPRGTIVDAAVLCRKNGWVVGTSFAGIKENRTDTITITAIGERKILVVWQEKGFESMMGDFSSRDWKVVQPPQQTSKL